MGMNVTGMEASVWSLIGVLGIMFGPSIWEDMAPSFRGLGALMAESISRQDDARVGCMCSAG